MFFRKTKKFAVGLLLTLFVFSSFTQFILSAQPVQAQLAVSVIADAQAQVESIWSTIKNGWKIAVMNAAQQAVGYFMRKVAYDSAVWLASGGKGQNPFAHTKSVGGYLKDVGNDAAGAAIDSFGKTFGLDLCKVPDIKLDLALRIGLNYNYGANPPKPACNLTTFASNWGNSLSSVYNNGVDPSKIFSASLKVDDTDLGINIKTTEKIDRLYAQQTDDARATRAEGGGFKAVTGLIDNRIKTPAAVTADEMKANAPNKQNDKSQAQIGAAMGSGAYEIIPSTLSIFLNTLSSQMLKNFRENGMLPFGCVEIPGVTGGKCPTTNANVSQNPNSLGGGFTGREAAQAVFSEFLTPKLTRAEDYDILTQLNSCDSQGLYNCRADDSLRQAIEEARHGDPLTIAEAMKRGFLHPTAKLIPPTNVTANQDPRCFDKDNNYCYSNIAVLRQLGVFPLGFEIAAKNSDPDNPVNLEEVVKGFYDCNYQKDAQGNIIGVNYDPTNYPFCHLVDPNWVIKLEQTRCDALGYGPSSIGSDVPDRLQECVDIKTCIGRDSTGNCLGYGNCAREKNVWKFDADKCESQFATCRSFTNGQGQQLSYLYRTLDTGSCDQSNVGCTAYSLDQNAGGWTNPGAANFSSNDNIYLNNKVSSCDASAAGCSAFRLVKNSSATNAPNISNVNTDLVYLKKAPDYLNCYDKDANSANGINWPQTLSDIIKMTPKAECNNYAKVCVASEVGCSIFNNVNDADAPGIPGKFLPAQVDNNTVTAWNDQCDARCVGYAAYQEMPTTYSGGNPMAYIIPPSKYNNNESGKECAVQDNNCTSFTNMESSEAGGEKVENFTLLRNCIKPDETKQKNFYTYEGSKVGGYQLQAYILQKYTNGSPLTVFKDQAERDFANKYQCNESLYKSHTADPDCRQFNDDQGNVYYTLMSRTVIVSADCAQYRLNSQELAGTGQCFGNGQFKDGACYYYGLPGGVVSNNESSQTCAAEMVSCRAYKGNHGNNIKTVNLDASSSYPIMTFETADSVSAQKGWSVSGGAVAWSNESAHAGQHSLELSGNNSVLSKSVPVLGDDVDKASDQSYDLTFWAKATGLNVSVKMTSDNGQATSSSLFSANNTWQVFKFHIKLPSSDVATLNNLVFTLNGNGSLFLDNIRLTKVSDYIYLVKNSLRVDSICDDTPDDNLPGAALGCTAYNGPKNSLGDTLYYLTNFSYLCRDGAIGCTAFKDTFNKITDVGPRVYNVFLPVAAPGGVKAVATIGNDTYSCQVEQGKTGCYVNIKGHSSAEISAGKVNNALAPIPSDSTYFVPADSTNSTTVYLVADGGTNSSCNAVDLGCTTVGKQTNAPSGVKYVTTTLKIDPNQFEGGADANGNPQSGTLCQKEAVGCDEYSSSQGSAYFKDPALSGNKICSFNTFTDSVTNKVTSGWFWKGVSVCGNISTLAVTSPKTFCSSDSDCSGSDSCLADFKDKQACYPDYKKNGNYFDLWSFGDTANYKNFVGECPSEQGGCAEFIDHADKDKPYYLINNKLSEGDCSGQVSQKVGCALFDQTDNPNKLYNTAATYAQSDNTVASAQADIFKVTKVNPVMTGNLDANRIIAVKRDRECAEWLQCAQSHSIWDDNLSKYRQVCDRIGRCDALPIAGQATSNINCSEFIDGNHEVSNKILTADVYVNRDVTFKGKEFVGYSILGAYPLEELGQYNVGNSGEEDIWRLAKAIPCAGNNCAKNSDSIFACASTSTKPCGVNNSGLCINQVCLQGPYGGNTDLVKEDSPDQICRSFPERDSPFPSSNFTNNQKFANVNKCDEAKNTNTEWAQKCECDYTKVVFGDGAIKKYWDYYKPDTGPDGILSSTTPNKIPYNAVPSGICTGGDYDGLGCAMDADCKNGSCQKLKKIVQLVGWRGYCVENDQSRIINGNNVQHPCLTWLPIDTLVGTKDINSQHPEAGFQPATDSKYCLAGQLYQKPKQFGKCIDYGNISVTEFGCDDQKCQTYGENYCKKFPGFQLKKRYPGEVTQQNIDKYNSDPNKDYYYFPGEPLSEYGADVEYCGRTLEEEGKDCSNTGTDDCAIECVPDPSIIKKGDWVMSENPISASATNIGCQIGLSITNLDVAWTDNIWKNKKNFELTVKGKDKFFDNRLNFNYSSPQTQFAILDPAEDLEKNLIVLMYCQTGTNLTMPYRDGSCDAAAKKVNIKNLTYGTWQVGESKLCADDSTCNSGAACIIAQNNANPDKCQRSCRTNADCSFTYNNFDTQNKVTSDLGACKNYIPAQGGNPEKLGHCTTLAENACIENPQGFYGDECSGGYQQTCTDQNGQQYDCGKPPQCYSKQSNECKEVTINGGGSGKCVVGSVEPGKCNDKSSAVGKQCFSNDDCYNYVCLGKVYEKKCVAIGAQGQGASGGILQKVIGAFEEFQQLFARIDVNNFALFSTKNQKYENLSATDASEVKKIADITIKSNPALAPKVRPVGDCNSSGKCLEVNQDGFSINGLYNQNVIINIKPYIATARFYMFADANHMPINKVMINWGDDTQVIPFGGVKGVSAFRNQRGATSGTCFKKPNETKGLCKIVGESEFTDISCATDNDCKYLDICQPGSIAKDFGSIKGQTCDIGYFETSHPYICKSGGKGWQPVCSDPQNFPNGCCEFKPVVQVIDNWGWCNGECPDGVDKTSGCYNGFQFSGGANQCDNLSGSVDLSKHANTIFQAKVIVPPNKIEN